MRDLENIKESRKSLPYNTFDGAFITLVEFALDAARILHPEFNPPIQWSEREEDREPHVSHLTTLRYGDATHGMNITHRIEYDLKTSGHAVDEVIVSCYGLQQNQELELRALRDHHDPRFIEISVAGPESSVSLILQRFETAFISREDSEDNIAKYLQVARSAARVHAWKSVDINILEFLKHHPNHPEALMYLGISRAAQGFEPEGETLLLSSLTLDPRNHDAYYNLGLLVLRQGRRLLARDCFNKGLSLESSNHPLLFQLGQALEQLGDLAGALKAYEETLKNSPDPNKAWGHSGLDFTTQAQEAVERIKRSFVDSD